MTGRIKRIVGERGFGFIEISTTLPNVFFHVSGCLDLFEDLRPGDLVDFEIQHDGRGRSKAINVTKG